MGLNLAKIFMSSSFSSILTQNLRRTCPIYQRYPTIRPIVWLLHFKLYVTLMHIHIIRTSLTEVWSIHKKCPNRGMRIRLKSKLHKLYSHHHFQIDQNDVSVSKHTGDMYSLSFIFRYHNSRFDLYFLIPFVTFGSIMDLHGC